MSAITLFHVFAALYYASALYYGFSIEFPVDKLKPSKQYSVFFFTGWNMGLQFIYFVIALLNDFSQTNNRKEEDTRLLRKIRDGVFTSLALPTSLAVSLLYWIIYAIDRELHYPKVMDDYIPFWYNHVLHTNILLLVLLEQFLVFHKYEKKIQGLLVFLTLIHIYIAWMHIVNYFLSVWPYPLLHRFDDVTSRILFLEVLSLTGGSLVFLIGEKLNHKLWPNDTRAAERRTKKS